VVQILAATAITGLLQVWPSWQNCDFENVISPPPLSLKHFADHHAREGGCNEPRSKTVAAMNRV